MSTIPLGKLEKVDLRQVWANEASAFTPWLADEINIALLGETIGIELELEAQEKDVGPFRADILCKDTATGTWVLIENQLERTDHGHLGQLLTYAAGLQAVTVVWIAQRFTEEHRATLDWLNEITDDRFSFFGLEVELWRIGNSSIAPKFNVVCKPNDWSKTVRGVADHGDGELSEIQQAKLDFWTGFVEYLRQGGATPLKPPSPRSDTNMGFGLGRSGVWAFAHINRQNRYITAGVAAYDKQVFRQLLAHKSEIEAEMGEPLEWTDVPDRKLSEVGTSLDCDPTDRAQRDTQFAWLKEKLEKIHKVFSGRVKRLRNVPEQAGASA